MSSRNRDSQIFLVQTPAPRPSGHCNPQPKDYQQHFTPRITTRLVYPHAGHKTTNRNRGAAINGRHPAKSKYEALQIATGHDKEAFLTRKAASQTLRPSYQPMKCRVWHGNRLQFKSAKLTWVGSRGVGGADESDHLDAQIPTWGCAASFMTVTATTTVQTTR